MVVWKETQHEDDDARPGVNVASIATLWGCGLFKFFHAPNMISHVKLLEYILRMWKSEQQYFEVGGHILTVEVEDIYFLIGLSSCGAPMSLARS